MTENSRNAPPLGARPQPTDEGFETNAPSGTETRTGTDAKIDTDSVNGEVPPHPHPLSNDIIDEPLPGRTPREETAAAAGIGATPRRLLAVIGGIVLCLVAAGVIGSAALWGERWETVALGVAIAVVAVIVMATPILLAAGTKVVQDEAVRDAKTPNAPERDTARR